jgi:hypothetical protein
MVSDSPLKYSIQQSFDTQHLINANAAFEIILSQENGRFLNSNFIDAHIPDLNILKLEPRDKIANARFVKLSSSKILLLVDFTEPSNQQQT